MLASPSPPRRLRGLADGSLAAAFVGSTVAPEVVAGCGWDRRHSPQTYASLAKLHPLGRVGEVEDVVDAVLYLESAAFVTGEILHVDGGRAAGLP